MASGRFFAAVDQDGSLASVSADGFSSDGDGFDMGVEVWDAKETINWLLYIAVPFTPVPVK